MTPGADSRETTPFDYIVVGSGAGGGPLAARLALAGSRVLLIEAGSNQATAPASDPAREVSQVPALHAVSTEHEALSWEFFVKHYDTPPTGDDPKWHHGEGDPEREGIFYPRTAALGGCTVHNAMITIAGPDSDWDDLADFLDDPSWRAAAMRQYLRRLERNEYLGAPTPLPTSTLGRGWDNLCWLFGFDPDHTGGRHGFGGWLHTSVTDISLGLGDKQLVKVLKAALLQSRSAGLDRAYTLVRRFLKGQIQKTLDPNHFQTQADSPEGLVLIPLAVNGPLTTINYNAATPGVIRGRRSSPREFLLEVQTAHPDRLEIQTECLVTKVILDGGKRPRAIGVEYLKGGRLYRAHQKPSGAPGVPGKAYAKREVILAGGTFNTPQLLMLSGIGDRAHLAEHGIECVVHRPGVGLNLQDRYEVTVISDMARDFSLLEGAGFRLPDGATPPDAPLREWREKGLGLYSSNGAVLGIFKRSRPDLSQPDLFIFGLPLPFEGYEKGYSKVGDEHGCFTWAILKGRTRNCDGTVRLRSTDPRAVPAINFHYFNERSRPGASVDDPDLAALVDGVKFVRGIAKHARLWARRERHPGVKAVPDDSDARIKDWIRREAWGHHACGTCRMGPEGDAEAVVDPRFAVHGVDGLRVVDASIFPTIPGYFIVTNVYMAAEKAADVILADASGKPAPDPVYPGDVQKREAEALAKRRAEARPEAGRALDASGVWSDDVTGLALSGGGIRSATFNLGILQAFARCGWLRRVDFLSTVSGGGYIGSFLGRFFDRLRHDPGSGGRGKAAEPAIERVEHALTDPDAREIGWLRRNGNYISPSGEGDARVNTATFVRNFVSVHAAVGALVFALFGLATGIHYGLFDASSASLGLVGISQDDLPLGHLVHAALGVFWSPWFVVVELLLLFMVLPRLVGFWLASQDRSERYQWQPLVIVFLLIVVLLYLAVSGEKLVLPVLFLALSLLTSFVAVELAWRRGRTREAAIGSGGVETQRLRTRNYLTYDLGLALAVTGGVLVFALVDTIGHALQQWLVAHNASYAAAFAAFGAGLTAALPLVRMLAQPFLGDRKGTGPPSTISRLFREQLVAGAIAVVLFTLPLVFYAFAAHAAYQGGTAWRAGMGATLLALAVSLVLRGDLAFVNRSSLAAAYGARLARAYLGASNPLRHRPEGANITEVMPGDDVASIRDYRPHEAGGPFHLINITVNQTVDFTSQRGNRDRKGENVAVSCLGMSVGKASHGLWADARNVATPKNGRKRPWRLEPAGHLPGADHPLIDETGEPTNGAEMLSLREWMSISGAAVGPGRGQTTQLGTALLFGLANLRTGYWWDSGITEAARDGFPKLTFLRRFFYVMTRLFIVQSLILFEWIARYPGPWERFWYISDGGFFENMGGYELVRRRVPRIIVCDGSADPTYDFEGFAELVRKVRIDFAASIEPFTPGDLEKHVPAAVRDSIGTLDELRPAMDPNGVATGAAKKRAALFWVCYETHPGRRSVLLFVKATVAGNEDADVRQYRAAHPEFPHESTGDQFFDEAQWESYRRLGEQLASPLLVDADWFWKIPTR